jgi:hypothetical protein
MSTFYSAFAAALTAAVVKGEHVSNIANLVLADLDQYPHARCLDGSPAAMYYRQGEGDGATKWFIFLEGGGLCDSVEDCTARSTTGLGSSKDYAATMDLNTVPFMSTSEANPFRDWNQVFGKYCDGSMWTGARESPSNGLWWSGHHSVAALADFIKSSGQANEIILSGGSAGGIGVFNNVDFFKEHFEDSVMILGAPVGGFPPQLVWYTGPNATIPEEDGRDSNAVSLVDLYGAYLPKKCTDALAPSNQAPLCVYPYHVYDYVQTPVFIIEAFSDSVIMCDFSGLACDVADIQNPAAIAYVQDYASRFKTSAERVKARAPRDGLFAASCFMHTEFAFDGPLINDTNAIVALNEWYKSHLVSFKGKDKKVPEHKTKGTVTDDSFVWFDQCSDAYWPPCGNSCPANVATHVP